MVLHRPVEAAGIIGYWGTSSPIGLNTSSRSLWRASDQQKHTGNKARVLGSFRCESEALVLRPPRHIVVRRRLDIATWQSELSWCTDGLLPSHTARGVVSGNEGRQ